MGRISDFFTLEDTVLHIQRNNFVFTK